MITRDQLALMIPYASKEHIDLYYPHIISAMKEFQINTLDRICAFIAQITHESGSLRYSEEIADGKAYEYRKDLGNLEPEALEIAHANYSTTGPFYKGRGLIQLTGFYNYRMYGKILNIDLIHNPELAASPEYSSKIAAAYWKRHGCNELADVGAFGKITYTINGGYNGAKERLANFANNKKVLKCT